MWKSSLYYFLTIYLIILGFLIGNYQKYDSPMYCIIKSTIDSVLSQAYTYGVTVRIVLFVVMIKFPIFYKNRIERTKNKKILFIYCLISAVYSCVDNIEASYYHKEFIFCNSFELLNDGERPNGLFEIIFLLVIIFPIQLVAVLSVKKIETDNIRKGVITVLWYTDLTFLITWGLPNIFIYISICFNAKDDIVGMLFDINFVTVSIATILEFPFNYYKNKEFKKYVKEFIERYQHKNTITPIGWM
uniref:G_PROTEIN_RECEP_F1_2 domain-containing protein n=1 Tax=Parastrongyloides trichosuri TaxID=131310 RepID=A0A0N4ZV62_PARTI